MNFSVDRLEESQNFTKFYKLTYHLVKNRKDIV